jgi:large subunit ribosomal protein L13e
VDSHNFIHNRKMKHNNQLPNAHFRKDWHLRVRVRLNQAARKLKRSRVRKAKAAAIAPRPASGLLRPAVHCPTQRYNAKVRVGRGFTLEELKGAGITKAQARAKGVAIDYRRRNKSKESLDVNVQRLKAYLARVVVNPKKEQAVQLTGVISKLSARPKIEGAVITAEMKSAQVVRTAKQSEATRKLEGRKRWAKKKEDAPAAGEGGAAESED